MGLEVKLQPADAEDPATPVEVAQKEGEQVPRELSSAKQAQSSG